MASAINALNDGKGFGVRSGEAVDKYFLKLNYTWETYEAGERDTVGRAKAMKLFPQLDFIVGMGDKCPNGDVELIKFAEEADDLKRVYFTTRGPSKVLSTGKRKDHFFSIHLNSDQYPQTAIAQYALRGLRTAAVIWEDSANWFFEGVGENALKLLELRDFDIQVNQRVRFDEDGPDLAMVNRSIQWAIGNGSDVLMLSMRSTVLPHVLDLLQDAAPKHAFPALWAVNIPWGNNCAGEGIKCSFAVGASQMSEEEIQFYKDGLLGVTYREFEASEHFLAPPEFTGTTFWDIASITSSIVQAIQNFYRFRPLNSEEFLSDPAKYEELRAYMREGSLLGDTFAGPTRFTETGANGGRAPSTMQIDAGGVSRLIFPADLAVASFQFPSPGSIPCALNFFRNYSETSCPLCAHQCTLCPEGAGWVEPETCGCLPGFYNLENPVSANEPSACLACPDRGVCEGGWHPPYPLQRAWGEESEPEEFHECRLNRCEGGAGYECTEGFGGRMCEDPDEGWSSVGRSFRVKCPSSQVSKVLMHVALCFLVLLFFSLNMVLSMHYEAIGIFLETMQRLAIVSHFWLRWPERFSSLFTVFEVILLEADLTPPECLMEWDFAWSFWTQISTVALFLGFVWLPVLLSVARTVRQMGCSWREAAAKREYNAQSVNVAMGHSLDILVMVYPALVKLSFDAFVCRELGGQQYLVVDPNFKCYSSAHIATMVFAGLLQPVFTFGLPVGFVFVLYRGTLARTLHEQQNIERFGPLYRDFKPPFLWWEAWRTTQKLLLVALQVFLWRSPLLQGNMALLLFLCSLTSHFYAKPYLSRLLDVMDSLAYFTSILFTMAGLLFYSPDCHWRDHLFGLTIAGLVLYAVTAAYMAFIDVRERVAGKEAAEQVKQEARRHLQEEAKRNANEAADEGVARRSSILEGGNDCPMSPIGGSSPMASVGGGTSPLASVRGGFWRAGSSGRIGLGSMFKGKSNTSLSSGSGSDRTLNSGNPGTLGKKGKLLRLPAMLKSSNFSNLAKDGLTELPRTLNGGQFRRWTQAGMCTPENYQMLKIMDSWLKPYVSDQSPTSQFSLLPEAEFYRNLNTIAPHMFEWIKGADEEDVQALKRCLGSILNYSTQPTKGYRTSIVPQDQSSVLYWLINAASREQRDIFYEYLELMQAADPRHDAALRGQYTSSFAATTASFVTATATSLKLSRKLSRRGSFDLESNSNGSFTPLSPSGGSSSKQGLLRAKAIRESSSRASLRSAQATALGLPRPDSFRRSSQSRWRDEAVAAAHSSISERILFGDAHSPASDRGFASLATLKLEPRDAARSAAAESAQRLVAFSNCEGHALHSFDTATSTDLKVGTRSSQQLASGQSTVFTSFETVGEGSAEQQLAGHASAGATTGESLMPIEGWQALVRQETTEAERSTEDSKRTASFREELVRGPVSAMQKSLPLPSNPPIDSFAIEKAFSAQSDSGRRGAGIPWARV